MKSYEKKCLLSIRELPNRFKERDSPAYVLEQSSSQTSDARVSLTGANLLQVLIIRDRSAAADILPGVRQKTHCPITLRSEKCLWQSVDDKHILY